MDKVNVRHASPRGSTVSTGEQPLAADEPLPIAVHDVLPMRARLVNARLLRLLTVLRVSAELRYSREVPLTSLHRRIVLSIGNYGGLTSVELVALTGHEKAQISRAVSALSVRALVERPSLRARITLTPAGQELSDRIMAISVERNEQITRGIGKSAQARFGVTIRRLTERASLLLAHERERAGETSDDGSTTRADAGEPSPMPDRLRHVARKSLLGKLVAPLLVTLSSYLGRSATIAYRRESGLSNFIWQIMSQIGEHQPITLAHLIALVYRDKSQVGRAVKWLEAEGLVERRPVRRRRDVLLNCTARGNTLYAQMCDSALRRDDYLFAELPVAERKDFIAVLDLLTERADALLAAEQAREVT